MNSLFFPLFEIWSNHAASLMMIAFAILLVSGIPLPFLLGALAFGFAWAAVQSGLLAFSDLQSVPDHLITEILLNPAFFSLPLILFLAELLVESGQMYRAAKAIKGLFNPALLVIDQSGKRGRKGSRFGRKVKNDPQFERSSVMSVIVPAAVMALLVAHQFGLSPELLLLALLIPAFSLFMLFMINWVLDLWVKTHKRRLRSEAGLRTAELDTGRYGRTEPVWPLLVNLAFQVILFGTMLFCLIVARLSLMNILVLLILLVLLFWLGQGRFKLRHLFKAANKAVQCTASVATMLMAAFCFLSVFKALGGMETVQTLAIFGTSPEEQSWLPLFGLLLFLAALGFVLDWLILSTLALPILMPLFLAMDFNSLLSPIWGKEGPVSELVKPLTAQDILIPQRLWMAALVWLLLIPSIVVYRKRNGEIAGKGLASWSGKTQDKPISMFLFVTLQIIGLIAVIVSPQTVLWLPSFMSG